MNFLNFLSFSYTTFEIWILPLATMDQPGTVIDINHKGRITKRPVDYPLEVQRVLTEVHLQTPVMVVKKEVQASQQIHLLLN